MAKDAVDGKCGFLSMCMTTCMQWQCCWSQQQQHSKFSEQHFSEQVFFLMLSAWPFLLVAVCWLFHTACSVCVHWAHISNTHGRIDQHCHQHTKNCFTDVFWTDNTFYSIGGNQPPPHRQRKSAPMPTTTTTINLHHLSACPCGGSMLLIISFQQWD